MFGQKKTILILFGLSGMAALIYEIIWIRPLSLIFGTTVYAVSIIISAFIFGLAIGSWLAGKYSDRMKNTLRYFAFIQIGIGLYGLLLLPVFSLLPGVYLELYKTTFPYQEMFYLGQFSLAFALISIPATMMGTTLPLLMKSYSKQLSTVGHDVGKLDASNSFGAMVGSLVAGFIMIPILGIQTAITITAFLNIGIGFFVIIVQRQLKPKQLVMLGIMIGFAVFFVPHYDYQLMNWGIFFSADAELSMNDIYDYIENENVLFYKESLYSSIMVSEADDIRSLSINGRTQCSTDKETVSGLHNMASIPYELYNYNYGEPKTALNVGLGCGVTSDWISKRIDNTTTVEIDKVVVDANKLFFDHKHEIIIDDARNWLLRNEKKFDIITTEPSDPFAHQGTLFTKEFFEIMKKRLSENGLVSQWVPVYEMTFHDLQMFYNTYHSVFPYVYMYQMEENDFSQLLLIGSKKSLEIPHHELFIKSYKEISTNSTELNTDDKPTIEFSTASNFYHIPDDELIKIVLWLYSE